MVHIVTFNVVLLRLCNTILLLDVNRFHTATAPVEPAMASIAMELVSASMHGERRLAIALLWRTIG